MPIKCTTPIAKIEKFFDTCARIMAGEIRRALAYLGEQSVKRIRDRSKEESWIDQTGNLRSSIGYSIYEHGKSVIGSDFPVVMQGTKGQSEGRRMVEELAKEYSNTYALVVVAAMSYAEYVEAIESKDVLKSTEIWAKQQVDDYLAKAAERAEKKINKLKLEL